MFHQTPTPETRRHKPGDFNVSPAPQSTNPLTSIRASGTNRATVARPYRGPDGRIRSRSFDRKVDADRWLVARLGSIDRGEWIAPEAGTIPLSEAAADWLAGLDIKPRPGPATNRCFAPECYPSSGTFRQIWKPAVEAAGLEQLRIHDLRGTAASLMISSGANIKAVQRQLGHASAAMTLDLYGHLYEDDLDTLADALDRRYAAATAPAHTRAKGAPDDSPAPLSRPARPQRLGGPKNN